jgi:hypothetical protein
MSKLTAVAVLIRNRSNRPERRGTPSRVGFLSALIGFSLVCGCASTRRTVLVSRPISVALHGAEDVEAEVRPTCQHMILGALGRRGLRVGGEGQRWTVSVWFGSPAYAVTGGGVTAVAELTATRLDVPNADPILVSGNANDITVSGGFMLTESRSRLAACAAGAERLADAIIDATP